jgi:hypothetical protein
MKNFRRILTIATAAGGTMIALALLSLLFNGGKEETQPAGVPLAAVETGVRAVLGQLSQEKAQQMQQAEQDATDTSIGVAHGEVLKSLAEFENMSAAVTCARKENLRAKLEAGKAEGVSFKQGLAKEFTENEARWAQWRANSNGAISGEAALIEPLRALQSDTTALLLLGDETYSGIRGGPCAETVFVAVYNLTQASLAVASGIEQEGKLIGRAEGERSVRVNWAEFTRTGNPVYKQNVEALAQQHGLDLAALGIDVNSIAVVEAQ